MKTIILKEEKCNDCIAIYNGLKDYFGKPIKIIINKLYDTPMLKLKGKNPDYKSHTKYYQEHHLKIGVPEFIDVIDVSKQTLNFLKENFNDCVLPYDLQVW